MSIELDGAKLKRGDSYRFTVTTSNGTIDPTDILEFAVRRKITDPDPAILSKSSINGGIIRNSATEATIILNPADTQSLTKGTYYWEFQRKSADGLTVDTLINSASGETYGVFTVELDLLRT